MELLVPSIMKQCTVMVCVMCVFDPTSSLFFLVFLLSLLGTPCMAHPPGVLDLLPKTGVSPCGVRDRLIWTRRATSPATGSATSRTSPAGSRAKAGKLQSTRPQQNAIHSNREHLSPTLALTISPFLRILLHARLFFSCVSCLSCGLVSRGFLRCHLSNLGLDGVSHNVVLGLWDICAYRR